MEPIRLAVLASGGGSTAEVVCRACLPGGESHGMFQPVCLITRRNAGVIDRWLALDYSPDAIYCYDEFWKDPERFSDWLLCIYKSLGVQIWGQWGFLPKTPKEVVRNNMGIWGVNQHPAPLPCFGGDKMWGLTPHAAVLRFWATGFDYEFRQTLAMTEAVCHLVTPEYDQGPVIAATPLKIGARAATLDEARRLQLELLRLEHSTQIGALKLIVDNQGQVPSQFAKSGFAYGDREEEIRAAKEWAIAWDFNHQS